MQYIDTLILAILQGLTEFLPISSSGHLVIGQKLLNINLPGNAFEVVLHLGTLM
ncbi:MAG: undecaprenyl-diphosphate phosphatase, partial [Candidatus Neomarinimicrobiota bacterium]|nr:undecaprenyl-diphosphate phosphatase [Candidatus Neomarinimicrobiota bacterium]